MLGVGGQHEAVGQEQEESLGAGRRSPVKISVGRQSQTVGGRVGEVAVGPVAHDVKGGIAIGHQLGSWLPVRQRGMVAVGVRKRLGKILERLLDFGAVPVFRAIPQTAPAISAQSAEHDVLEQVHGGPLRTQRQADLISGLDLVAGGKELIPGGWDGAHAGRLEDLGVVPHDVRAVNIHGHRVRMTILGDQWEQGLGQHITKALSFEEVIQRSYLIGSYVGTDNFLAGVGLP